MADLLVDDLAVRGRDAAGNEILEILRRVPKTYAIYRTDVRVMLHYNDVPAEAEKQRALLAPIAALRGQVGGLIHDWYLSGDANKQAKAACYDQKVADALVIGFEGRVEDAAKLLQEIRDEIIGNRTALAQSQYLAISAAVAMLIFASVGITSLITDGATCNAGNCPGSVTAGILNGVIGGTIGAFFSIATGLRNRTVLTDLQFYNNAGDALLRTLIGAIAGGVLICLAQSGLVPAIDLAKATRGTTNAVWMPLFVTGFLAGFSERMVPDLLGRASLVAKASASNDAAVGAAKAAVQAAPAGQAQPAGGAADPAKNRLGDAPPAKGEPPIADANLPKARSDVATASAGR